VWPFSATANQTPAAALGTSLPAASGGVADAPLDGLQTLSLFATEQAAATPARVSQREEDGTLRLELLPIEELRRANGC
jgi:hypothetical protein